MLLSRLIVYRCHSETFSVGWTPQAKSPEATYVFPMEAPASRAPASPKCKPKSPDTKTGLLT